MIIIIRRTLLVAWLITFIVVTTRIYLSHHSLVVGLAICMLWFFLGGLSRHVVEWWEEHQIRTGWYRAARPECKLIDR
jgi:hypothetical protein